MCVTRHAARTRPWPAAFISRRDAEAADSHVRIIDGRGSYTTRRRRALLEHAEVKTKRTHVRLTELMQYFHRNTSGGSLSSDSDWIFNPSIALHGLPAG